MGLRTLIPVAIMASLTLGGIGCGDPDSQPTPTPEPPAEIDENQKITAPNATARDYFGSVLAVSGDTAVVGAPGDDDDGEDAGSAWLFSRDAGSGSWRQVARLGDPNAAAGGHLGGSVSISGDIAIVGGSSSAHVFSRDAGGTGRWGRVAKLVASDGIVLNGSVSVSGDVAIVGAVGYAESAGATYVFYRHAGGTDSWGQVAKLSASDAAKGDWFGYAVSVSGDVAVVGARFANDYGAAYVFHRHAGGTDNWGQVAKLAATDPTGYSGRFGESVSISAEIAVVGDSGLASAYIFDRHEGGTDKWGFVEKVRPVDPTTGASDVVKSVSVSGDILVVGGGVYIDDPYIHAGSAYVFHRHAGGIDNWGQVVKLTPGDFSSDHAFGQSVSVAGNIVVVGAPYDDGAGANSGSAYVFDIATHTSSARAATRVTRTRNR